MVQQELQQKTQEMEKMQQEVQAKTAQVKQYKKQIDLLQDKQQNPQETTEEVEHVGIFTCTMSCTSRQVFSEFQEKCLRL